MHVDDVKVGPIYSPYPTGDFQRCPRLWSYKKRWEPKGEHLKTAKMIGSAVALGLEAHYDGQGRDPVETAVSYAQANYYEGSDRTEDGVVTLVRRGVKHGMATNLGLREILGVEKFYGRIKPDLVGRDDRGKLCVVDHKVRINLDDRYKEKAMLEYDVLNQLFHYAWALYQEYGQLVDRAVIHMIVLAPRVYTELHPVPMNHEKLGQWLDSVVRDWRDMERGEDRMRQESCVGKFVCDFWDACHVYHGDESCFEVLYERKPERRG